MNIIQRLGRAPLLGHRDFRLLLSGAATSQFGSQVTLVALPLVAVLELDASPFQVGLLTAAETAAFLLVGLPAGAWLDRVRRLPVLIRADLARCLAVASVPLAAVTDTLTTAQLYLVALITGVATVFFDVAHQSFLPQLLPREQLVAGNGALETVRSVAQVGGPGLGGGLVQLLGAPLAIVADALGYLASALFLLGLRTQEPKPKPAPGSSLRAEIGEGVGFVLKHPLLRMIATATAASNLFGALLTAVQTVFWVRVLGLSAGAIGLLLSVSALGGLAGALCAGALARRVGQARLIWLSTVVSSPFAVLWPLSGRGAGVLLFGVASAVVLFGAVVYNVAQVSFRQVICPPELLGRMNATMRFLVWGTMPLGALAGGALATAAGPRAALWVCAAGFLAVPLPLLLSPLRGLRDLPADGPHAHDTADADPGPDVTPESETAPATG
ncbi:putative MFS family arabinose efflux permease [Kitasatospora sp. SolWspMP-SS2h]|uniref:MFS transporter n=1 Tax=Kitasatospora sp. SolWspMP-SS2h TaxID=1305729 RepID=UPI000DBAC8EC|nr:MFS transporter [Kitasatospora sp. SolWspMP-SS2h]RAJ31789.1 putative MFS family arabinose efflux permease [Kitasatospora sp. SolWspMP-SS2h]